MKGSRMRYSSSSLLKNAQTCRVSPSCEPASEIGALLMPVSSPVKSDAPGGLWKFLDYTPLWPPVGANMNLVLKRHVLAFEKFVATPAIQNGPASGCT